MAPSNGRRLQIPTLANLLLRHYYINPEGYPMTFGEEDLMYMVKLHIIWANVLHRLPR